MCICRSSQDCSIRLSSNLFHEFKAIVEIAMAQQKPLPNKNMFGNMVAGAFQITFRVKMHVNDVFLFFKNYF